MRLLSLSAIGVMLALMLVGCASPPTPYRVSQPRVYQDDIALAGRLSVNYQQDGKAQSLQGKFSWAQTRDTTDIALLSPLGQTMAKIAVSPAAASLQLSGEPLRRAGSVSELTTGALGWDLPVAGLRDWLQGFVRLSSGTTVAAPPDKPAEFNSEGWRIRYVSWQGDNALRPYPKRIDLERQTSQAGMLALRIVIDSWQPK